MAGNPGDDRRHYRRVHAPVTCRAAGLHPRQAQPQAPIDISLGGLRIYASEEVRRGARLDLELFLTDNSSVTCTVEVVWVETLPPRAPARYDVGLRFLSISEGDRRRLAAVLGEAEGAP